MKLFANMIVHNGEPYVRYAIKSILPHVDKLIIVYGAQAEYRNQPKDNTKDIIMELSREHSDKIIPFFRSFHDEAEQRNFYLDFIREYEPKPLWIWIVDSDEFYKPEDIKSIKDNLKLMARSRDLRHCRAVLYPFINFYGLIPNGFNYYKENKTGMLKLIKWQDDLIYNYDESKAQILDNIGDSEHYTLWELPRYELHYLPWIRCYHYGHVASEENYLNKLDGSCLRDKTNPQKKHLQLLPRDKRVKWIKSNYPIFSENWIEKMELKKFTGEHPEVIKEMRKEHGL